MLLIESFASFGLDRKQNGRVEHIVNTNCRKTHTTPRSQLSGFFFSSFTSVVSSGSFFIFFSHLFSDFDAMFFFLYTRGVSQIIPRLPEYASIFEMLQQCFFCYKLDKVYSLNLFCM